MPVQASRHRVYSLFGAGKACQQYEGGKVKKGRSDQAEGDPPAAPLLNGSIDRIGIGCSGQAHQFRNKVSEGSDQNQEIHHQGY